MKKKDIKAKFENALHLVLLEFQFTPSKKIKKSLAEFSKDLASHVKGELKRKIQKEKKFAQKAKKVKSAKTV